MTSTPIVPAPPAPGRVGAARQVSRWRRVQPPLLLAAGVLAASVALHLRDPHQQGSWGLCPWLLLTGTHCPGCGGLRAVNDLTHGDVVAAASSNLLLVAGLPALVALWLRSLVHRWHGIARPWPPHRVNLAATLAVGTVVVFTVARNLPVDALRWLAP